MGLPQQPVTLTAEQIARLNEQLAELRHSVNNHLSLVIAAAEMIRLKPELAQRMALSLSEQPAKITKDIRAFSDQLEKNLGITRD